MNENMQKLIEALRDAKFEKKPTVKQLLDLAGVSKLSSDERNEAWAAYIAERDANPDNPNNSAQESNGIPQPIGYSVKSVPESFRRAGIEFTREGENIPADDMTPELLETLRQEPMLSVEPVYKVVGSE